MTHTPEERPIETEGVPAEEGVQPAKVADQLDEDPEEVPNAPDDQS